MHEQLLMNDLFFILFFCNMNPSLSHWHLLSASADVLRCINNRKCWLLTEQKVDRLAYGSCFSHRLQILSPHAQGVSMSSLFHIAGPFSQWDWGVWDRDNVKSCSTLGHIDRERKMFNYISFFFCVLTEETIWILKKGCFIDWSRSNCNWDWLEKWIRGTLFSCLIVS